MVEGHVILDRGGSNPFIRTTTKTPERVFFCCGADKGDTNNNAISQENFRKKAQYRNFVNEVYSCTSKFTKNFETSLFTKFNVK